MADGDYMDRLHRQYADILAHLTRVDWAAVHKPAVVMDVDETAVCNIPGATFRGVPMTGRPIPGALAVANFLAQRRVPLYFVTARPHTARDHTVRQLHAAGFRFAGVFHQDRGVMPNYGQYKRTARGLLAKHHTIVASIGDQPGDVDSHCQRGFLLHNPYYRVK